MPDNKKPLFLITNDDGYFAPGLQALTRAVRRFGRVAVVAPDREQSATGHSLTLHAPLRVVKIEPDIWSVSGTPTDCVNVAIHHLLTERPAMLLSGINAGSNLGNDVTYSGTVAAAMEGTLIGIPSVAFSQRLDRKTGAPPDYKLAARLALRVIKRLLTSPLPAGTLLNVNFPVVWTSGAAVVRLGRRHYDEAVTRRHDPMGKPYYWIGGAFPTWKEESGTDYATIRRGAISLTPLQLDLTHYPDMPLLEQMAGSFSAKKKRR
jgi:5'-nucleotidase